MLAPYSEIARSKLASGRGTSSALPCRSGNSIPNFCWNRRAVASCASLLSQPPRGGELRCALADAAGPGAAPRQPGGNVAGAAAELDRVLPLQLRRQQADFRLGHAPEAPARFGGGPVFAAALHPLLGVAVPVGAVARHVLGQLAHRPSLRKQTLVLDQPVFFNHLTRERRWS